MTDAHPSPISAAARRIAVAATIAAVTVAAAVLGPVREEAGPKITGEIQHFILNGNPREVPGVRFHDAKGRVLRLADFRGRVVLVNFWASWCAPCLREMPSLDRLQGGLGGPRFQVVAISLDREGLGAVEPFFRKTGVKHLRIYLDPKGELQRAMGVAGLPTSVLIDARGREVGRLVGPARWVAPEAVALIRHYMARARR